MKQTPSESLPRPFLKWVGGKGRLVDLLLRHTPSFKAYHEPFAGGGAFFFRLYRAGRLKGSVYLSDSNTYLIDAWLGVRDTLNDLIPLLNEHKQQHSKVHYYAVRADSPETLAERAARILYLNRTCFNGLFRLNSRGEFNVPMGRYVNPRICDEANLEACSLALQQVNIEARPFETVVERAVSGDFVYFDPPYHPVSKTSSFTSYDIKAFTEADQERLADLFRKLHKKKVKLMLSNSDTPFIRELYKGFTIDQIFMPRNVNSVAEKRGAVPEVIVRNY